MLFLLMSLIILVISAVAAILVRQSLRWTTIIGAGGAVIGSAIGLIPVAGILLGNPVEHLNLPWSLPYASFSISIDLLSGFFLLPICLLSALAAIFGADYLTKSPEKNSSGTIWFMFNILTASMILTVAARNAILFLFAWEGMSLSSFFLVMIGSQGRRNYQPAWTYLIATHFSTAFLLVLFILLGKGAANLDFDQFVSGPELSGILFILALAGFGIKAGFIPFHVWLPEAYEAVPGHILAVMSGVMIKTAIYGILRTLTLLGPPAAWWGWTLIIFGLISGILGVLFALAQHELRRFLGYHSIENMGIIAMGIGIGLLGLNSGSQIVTVLGFGGALLHVINHALFKGLLFLTAGAVMHAAGTEQIDRLGGLLKKMPYTGTCFLIGAVAISGLPPLNGFVSEFLIYLGAFKGSIVFGGGNGLAVVSVIAGLALCGGLAAACFTKAFGIIFLGEPRTDYGIEAQEVGLAMRIPMLILVGGCVLIGLDAPIILQALIPVIGETASLSMQAVQSDLTGAMTILSYVVIVQLGFILLLALLVCFRRQLPAGRTAKETGTWDCGYAQPTARMQYTSSSFAQPLTDLFASFLQTERFSSILEGFFPSNASFHSHTPDVFRERLYRPVFVFIEKLFAKLRWLQHGRVHLYILYIMLTLLVLLVWKIG